jgi:hypothetical protein
MLTDSGLWVAALAYTFSCTLLAVGAHSRKVGMSLSASKVTPSATPPALGP